MTLKRLIIRRNWDRMGADDPGHEYVNCVVDIPDDSPLKKGAEILAVEDV